MPQTLRSVGWRVSTGPLVWNRRRADLGPCRPRNGAPVLWAADLDGGQLHRDPSKGHVRWLALQGSDIEVMLLEGPAVLIQRTTSPEQQRRLVCVELTPERLQEWGGRIVVENHVNVLRPERSADQPLTRSDLTAILSTRTIDRLLRCVSGSVAVSAYELESLPLPDFATLKAWSNLRGEELERVVAAAYRPDH
jgi:adenine-specific DNA-methyltransferase